jgi:hypothetical protein
MITYDWTIEKVKVTGDTNIVTHVYWRCEGKDEELSAACAGVKELTLGGTFTAYEQLTKQQVIDWCVDIKAAAEAEVASLIATKELQKATEPALPWIEIPA